jgi:hypothetical protein
LKVQATIEECGLNVESSKNSLRGGRLSPLCAAGLMDSIDGLTTVVGKALLVPVPAIAGA